MGVPLRTVDGDWESKGIAVAAFSEREYLVNVEATE